MPISEEDAKTIKAVRAILTALRLDGLILVMFAVSAVIGASVDVETWSAVTVGVALGGIIVRGLRMAITANTLIRDLDKAIIAELTRRNTR